MTTAFSTASGGAATASSPTRAPRTKAPKPPEQPGVARIVAIANQKGGVGKSTTAVSLGAALAEQGYRVLVIDLDPQGNASTGLGIRHEAREATVYDVIVAESPIDTAIVSSPIKGLDAVPATIDLAGAEIELVSQFSRETRLKKALGSVREGRYDFVILDCPPSLGLLTINALTAAEELIVPIQCEYYALEGLGQLLRNVSLVQQNLNPGLRLTGIVMTMFDSRTKLSEQVVAEVQRYFGGLVYDVIIPRTVRLSEAPGFGQPITVYDPRSKGAETYRELAREVALRPPPTGPMPTFEDLPTIVVPPLGDSITPDPRPDDVLEASATPHVRELVEEARNADEAPPVTAVPEVAETPASSAIEVPEAEAPAAATTDAPPAGTAVDVDAKPDAATGVEPAGAEVEAGTGPPPERVAQAKAPETEPPAQASQPVIETPAEAPQVPESPEPPAEPPATAADTPQPAATPTPTPVRPQRASRSGASRKPSKRGNRSRGRSTAPAPPAKAPDAPATAPEDAPVAARSESSPDEAPATEPGFDDFWEEVDLSPAPKVRPPSSPVPPGELPERRVVVVDSGGGRPEDARRSGPTGPYDVEQEPDSGLTDIGETLDEQEEAPPKRRWRLFRKGGE